MDAMSCLAPHPASFLQNSSSQAYYNDAAMARALHYSMSDHYSPAAASTSSPSSSSSLLADLPYSDGTNWFASTTPAPAPAPAPLTSLTCDSVLVASDAAPRPPSTPAGATTTPNKRRMGLGPTPTGRAGKRRPRASKRAPTTYISTDPANFRLMVQHVTGIQAEPGTDDGTGVFTPTSFDASAAALNCPTYTGASFADALHLPSDADAATLHHRLQQQQQQACFPTLDSWNVLYESAQLF